MNEQQQQLQLFLQKIQLNQFYAEIVNVLHITRVEHFDHVVESDLQSIGMSMPEIRRLFDHLKKNKKNPFLEKLKKSFGLVNYEEKNKLEAICKQDKFHKEPRQQDTKCLILEKNITFLEILGKGAFGYVRSAKWVTDSGEKILVAVKCIRSTGGNGVSDVQLEVVKEANAMNILNHPNLIRFYGIMMTSPLMLVTELAPLGALLRRLRQEPHKFLISTLSSFLVQIVAGMKYLEKNNIIHRDLAARNILLMSYEKVKIGDFGLARPLNDAEQHYVMKPDGLIPFAWCAPECLKYKKFSHASDVWACGVTAYEMFTFGAEPWAGLNGAQIFDKIEEPNCEQLPCPEMCPEEIYAVLCNNCWKYRENERASFEALEKHLLEVLPTELTASNKSGSLSDANGQLSFAAGDIITVFSFKKNDENCKGQNRRTGKIGSLPSHWVNLTTKTVKAQFDEPDKRYSDIEPKNRSIEGPIGFSNKLTVPLWDIDSPESSKNNASDSCAESTAEKPICGGHNENCKRNDYECDSFSSSGYVSTSEKGSFRDDCLSLNSVDSGCLCRCSTYSSDSSQPYTSDNIKCPASKPITIPGSADILRHKRKSIGSYSKRFSTGSAHSYAVISDSGFGPGSFIQPKRCSSCNSATRRYFILERENSLTSSSPLNEFQQCMSPDVASPIPSGMNRLKKAFSTLKLDASKKLGGGTNSNKSGTKSLPANPMGMRQRSLPDLINPRKSDLVRRTRKSFRAMKRHVSMNEGIKSHHRVVEKNISAPQAREVSLITSPVTVGDGNTNAPPLNAALYDLIPSKDSKPGEPSRCVEAFTQQQDDHDSDPIHHYMSPLSTPASLEDGHYKQPINTSMKIDLYENTCIAGSPIAPPRRKRTDPKHRFSMIEFSGSEDFSFDGNSPKMKQCVILD